MNSPQRRNFYDYERKALILTDNDLRTVSADIIESYAENTLYIDFSHNRLSDLTWIREFAECEEIILDDNRLAETSLNRLIGTFINVKVLMLNKNEFVDLHQTIEHLSRLFPNLQYLSLHGNAICPDGLGLRPFCDYIQYSYSYYRSFVANAFHNLKFLDHSSIHHTIMENKRISVTSNRKRNSFKEIVARVINLIRRQQSQQNVENNYLNLRRGSLTDEFESL